MGKLIVMTSCCQWQGPSTDQLYSLPKFIKNLNPKKKGPQAGGELEMIQSMFDTDLTILAAAPAEREYRTTASTFDTDLVILASTSGAGR